MPLAAWSGSREMLEAISVSTPNQKLPPGLVVWAARGAYVNLQSRQEDVVRWLLKQRAQLDERDQDGWSLLEWACWSGSEPLVALALRAGLLASSSSRLDPAREICSPMALAVASRRPGVVTMLLRAACDP